MLAGLATLAMTVVIFIACGVAAYYLNVLLNDKDD